MGIVDGRIHTLTLVMTENLLIPQRMLYQIPGDSMCMKIDKEGKESVSVHVCMCVYLCKDRQTWRQRDKKWRGRVE